MQHRAERLASRADHLLKPRAKIAELYRLTLGRTPNPREIELAVTFLGRRESALGRKPWEEYAQVLLGSNELAYLD